MTTSERFEQIQKLFHTVLNLPEEKRQEFLDAACEGDQVLRREIESLLAEDARTAGMLRNGSEAEAQSAGLGPGARLGPYEICEMMGAGGMGEVYRARDTKLRREVALKVLPSCFANDAGRIARLQHEARLLASLNHPHIAAIYGLEESTGVVALVMELVEGPTLAERIRGGKLAAGEAIGIARQIADALEAAHERGIVHRDLKPANVKVTPQGVVKVLDFGLGKLFDDRSGVHEDEGSLPATREGAIVGTAAYMSPEQARGAAVDKRSDIWSFGVVLYEALTGRRPFGGETTADVMAAVLRDSPDFTGLSPGMAGVIGRCIAQDPRNRWGSMGDVRWALDTLVTPGTSPAENRRYVPLAAAAVLLLGALAVLLWRPEPGAPLLQMEITAPQGVTFGGTVGWGQLALSPDGRRLVFIGTEKDGKRRLWQRSLQSGSSGPLEGTENVGVFPVWSPDSRWVGFNANGRFQKIDVTTGGPPQVICECAAGAASWNSDGTILFATRDQPLQRVSASGGKPGPVFEYDRSRGEVWQGGPDFLPDGRHFIYDSFARERGAVLASLDGRTRHFLGQSAISPSLYAPNPKGGGWLLYVSNAQLFSRPLNAERAEFTGEAKLVANAVADMHAFSVSANGLLAYRMVHSNPSQLTWFDRAGKRLGTPVEAGYLKSPRISPDQKTVAFVRSDEGNSDIWLLDTAQDKAARFTYEPGLDDYPVWSADSSRIVYLSQRQGERDLVERPASSTGPETVLFRTPGVASGSYGLLFVSKLPTGLTQDGRWVVGSEWFAASSVIWLIPRTAGEPPVRFTEGADGTVSPDGRWLLYATAGPAVRTAFVNSRPEVFVEALSIDAEARGGRKWQISTAGGANPTWSGDGREIFYLALDGTMMSVPTESSENSFRAGTPKRLFSTSLVPGGLRNYDVTRDGKRFLLNVPMPVDGEEPITVIQNWPKLLER